MTYHELLVGNEPATAALYAELRSVVDSLASSGEDQKRLDYILYCLGNHANGQVELSATEVVTLMSLLLFRVLASIDATRWPRRP